MDRMCRAGLNPHEEDFMDDYGIMAARKYAVLEGRYFRCMFAATRVDGFRFETYVFPSATDANEFKELMAEGVQWRRRDNLVLHGAPEHLDRLDKVLRKTFCSK
jgi:hypothetical protein